jgi:predicted membrane protein (TIGR00267 family)
MAEKAERERHLKDMEEATRNRVDPIHYEAARFVVIYVALIDGLSPALTATIALAPFILAAMKIISISSAYFISVPLSLAVLFLLGIYLGKVAKENGWLYGMAMVAVGALTALIIFIIQLFLAG